MYIVKYQSTYWPFKTIMFIETVTSSAVINSNENNISTAISWFQMQISYMVTMKYIFFSMMIAAYFCLQLTCGKHIAE